MPLINRFTRLVCADLNALLDRVEEPVVLLRQAVRDMEQELTDLERRARNLEIERERVMRDADTADNAITRLDAELDMCLAADEESLARNLVKRKLEAGRRRDLAMTADARLAAQLARLNATVARGRDELAHLRARLEAIAPPAGGEPDPDIQPGAGYCAISDEEIAIALLGEKERRGRR